MRVLRVGCKGSDVRAWQLFLRGQGLHIVVDGEFGLKTRAATTAFQSARNLRTTGAVDNPTLAIAVGIGLSVVDDYADDRDGPNWPEAPAGLGSLTQEGRELLFGEFSFQPAPLANNPEAIKVEPAWVRDNIVSVKIPLPCAPWRRPVAFHRLGAEKLRALFDAWQADQLLDRVITWDGSYAPRFIRGSRSSLSSHAWGSALDINARWNALGTVPALLGVKGCVRELVARANELGFWWGGHYTGRRDGMHFELVKL